jgi:ribulose-5-phosphate 4-epimerase/fuculose-1-phosphate aldolase
VLPISQQSTFILASLAYHDYEGIAVRADERPRLQKDLGGNTFLMLRNHGLLTVGSTVAEAFLAMYFFETTCQIQITAQAAGELIEVNPAIISGVREAMHKTSDGVGAQIAWPALIRKLDRVDQTYKT